MTLKWEKVRLGDVAELQRGFDLPSTKEGANKSLI